MTKPRTLGELKAQGYQHRTVKDEIRANLIQALRDRRPLFQGIIGYGDTVIPNVVNALLARHDFLLLGLRGQAKTRLLRALVDFLDGEIPVIDGAPVPEDPMDPVTPVGKRMAREAGDDLPVIWLGRDARYHEKLATPDANVADLVGDIDPIKAMSQKLDFASEDIIHYGLIPRANRGIFAMNELPDLQARIQVSLLNMLEEQDFQIRGFPIRMAIDTLMVFTANPEDYTNRGKIITPLKDRIEAQILTHYPASLEEGVEIIRQEAWEARNSGVSLEIADLFYDLTEQVAVEARDSEYVDRNSGVSARMPITLLETIASSMERRAHLSGDKVVHARVCDLFAAMPAITGKVELIYRGEQEGLAQVAEHLVGKAIRERFNGMFIPAFRRNHELPREAFVKFDAVIDWFESENALELEDTMSHEAFAKEIRQVKGLESIAKKGFPDLGKDELPCAMEFILEGLAQNFLISKIKMPTGHRYRDTLASMAGGV